MKRNLLLAIFTLMTVTLAFGQRQITGQVTSTEDGGPLPGVSVIVKGTIIGTTTNFDGMYNLDVPDNYNVLLFSFIGMKTKEVQIGSTTTLNVALDPDVLGLDEVVVAAIGVEREKKALGYAVQELSGDEINRSANTNMLNSMTGKVAGVQITSASGAAGGAANILIRGAASLTGNNQPLFVVDGVPIQNSQVATENTLFGVAYSNRAIDINPEDIETISILKGGAATALYGMGAANGVVMITTKRGQAGRMKIDVSSSVSIDQVNKLPEMQTKYGQGLFGTYSPTTTLVWGPRLDTMRFDASQPNEYYPQGTIVGQSAAPNGAPVVGHDNVNNFFRTGVTFNNNVSLSGGNDRSSYFFSLANLNQEGVVPNNDFRRTTATLSAKTRMTKRLTSSARVSYTRSGGTRIQQGSNTSGVMLALLRMPGNFDITGGSDDPANDPAAYQLADGRQRNAYRGGGYDNPFWTVNKNVFTDDVDRMIGYFQLDYDVNDWISVMYRLGNDFYSDRRKQTFGRFSRTAPAGRVIEDHIFANNLNSDLMVNIRRNLTDDLRLNVILGQNLFGSYSNRLFVQGDNLAILDYYNLNNTASQIVAQSIGRKRTAAVYADIGFDFKSMIYANITLRNEKSTTLPEENASFFFPSFSASFIFTELPGLQGNNVLPFGKIRVSWSKIANDAPIYSTEQVYVRASTTDGWTGTNPVTFPAFGVNSFQISTALANPNLMPEFATSREIGLDLRFMQNRLGFDFTYYNNLHEDLILGVPIAPSTGATTAILNAGSMKNVGIEAILRGTPVKSKDFTWDIIFNFTRNVNEVLELAEGIENVFLGGFVGSQARAVVGEPYGSIFGERWAVHDNGQRLVNEDGYWFGSGSDENIGNVLPDWILGITNSFNYKGIGLSFLWDIKKGGYMWNGTRGAMYYFGTHADTQFREPTDLVVFEGVDEDGNPNTIEVVRDINWFVLNEGSGFTGPAEEYVEQTDWVRLRELTLSYTLKPSVLQNTILRSAEVFFTGRNLFLSTPYTGIDPETSLIGAGNAQGLEYFNMPGTKSYMFGVRLGF
jgi:TonB-linked SusC/RagA family outer membrane protein